MFFPSTIFSVLVKIAVWGMPAWHGMTYFWTRPRWIEHETWWIKQLKRIEQVGKYVPICSFGHWKPREEAQHRQQPWEFPHLVCNIACGAFKWDGVPPATWYKIFSLFLIGIHGGLMLHGRNGNPQFWHLLLWCPPSTLSNFSTLGPNLLALAKLRSNTLPRQATAGCWIDAQGGRCEVHHRTKDLEQWRTPSISLWPMGPYYNRNCKQLLLHHTSLWNSVNIYINIQSIGQRRTSKHLR